MSSNQIITKKRNYPFPLVWKSEIVFLEKDVCSLYNIKSASLKSLNEKYRGAPYPFKKRMLATLNVAGLMHVTGCDDVRVAEFVRYFEYIIKRDKTEDKQDLCDLQEKLTKHEKTISKLQENCKLKRVIYVYKVPSSNNDTLYKIGLTHDTAEARTRGANTYTATNLELVHQAHCPIGDLRVYEYVIHKLLAEYRYPLSAGKEIFQVPLDVIIRTLSEVRHFIEKSFLDLEMLKLPKVAEDVIIFNNFCKYLRSQNITEFNQTQLVNSYKKWSDKNDTKISVNRIKEIAKNTLSHAKKGSTYIFQIN